MAVRLCRSGGLQIIRRGLASLSVCDQVKSNFLSLVEAVESGALNGADVNEHILAAIVRLDEAKAFLAVEPLYGSLRHENFFQVRVRIGPLSRSRLGMIEI